MIDIVIGGAGTMPADLLAAALADCGYRVMCAQPGGLAAAVHELEPRLVLTENSSHSDTDDGSDADLQAMMDAVPTCADGRPAVIVMSGDGRHRAVEKALRAGVRGYVHHSAGLDGLVDALRRVEGDEVVVVVPHQQREHHAAAGDVRRLAATLTTRELQCLALLVEGVSTDQITVRLGISTLTVRSHIQSILSKLGAHSRLEAATLAVRHGLLDPAQVSSRAG